MESPPETGSSVSPAAVHHRALHGSRGPSVFTDRHLKGNHVASERERNHYRRELMLMRAKELDKEEEEAALVRPSLLQEIRSRNRVDAIRRSARCLLLKFCFILLQIFCLRAELLDEPDWLMEVGPSVDPFFLRPSPPPPSDPLPFGTIAKDSLNAIFSILQEIKCHLLSINTPQLGAHFTFLKSESLTDPFPELRCRLDSARAAFDSLSY